MTLLDKLHAWIIMTFEELKAKAKEFQERFFRAGKLKASLASLESCLREMDEPFTFEVIISPWGKDKAVSFEIEVPEKDQCEYIRQAIGQLKLIHLKRLEQLGVRD